MNSFKIRDIEYIVDKTWQEDSFVGIKIDNNKYHVSFPLGYKLEENMDEEYYKKSLYELYKTVSIAKKIENNHGEGQNDNCIPFSSYIWILSDFFSNGLYKYNEKKYVHDMNGKINWKRTFKNTAYLSNGKPYYLDIITERKSSQRNIITELQSFCINKAIDNLVFLGDYKKVRCNILEKNIKKNLNYYIGVINSEYKNTNNDKKQLLLLKIKDILINCALGENKTISFGTKKYSFAWEKMIDKIFGTESDLSDFYPSASWHIKGLNPFESSYMREDSISINDKEKTIIIIDSKYYNNDSGYDNYPATSSIQKQIVYGEHVKSMKKYKDYTIYNMFFVPSKIKKPYEYLGFAKMNSKEIIDLKSYEKVHLYLFDTNMIIDKYLKHEKEEDLLFREILEKTGKELIN